MSQPFDTRRVHLDPQIAESPTAISEAIMTSAFYILYVVSDDFDGDGYVDQVNTFWQIGPDPLTKITWDPTGDRGRGAIKVPISGLYHVTMETEPGCDISAFVADQYHPFGAADLVVGPESGGSWVDGSGLVNGNYIRLGMNPGRSLQKSNQVLIPVDEPYVSRFGRDQTQGWAWVWTRITFMGPIDCWVPKPG